MEPLPADPFRLVPSTDFAPAARREVPLCGAPVALLWLPGRRARRGAPSAARPPFPPSHVPTILAEETVWSDARHALTPNRHPFADRHLLLWARTPQREPDRTMLATAYRLAEPRGAAVLGNSIGAAASIAHAHVHLVDGREAFLAGLPLAAWTPPDGAELPAGLELLRAAAPFPALLVGIRGPLEARATAAARLLQMRAVPAFNLVDQDGVTWLYPRSPVETPHPHFPQALGAAELWGRWCHQEREAFDAADERTMLGALAAAGCSAPEAAG
ncbi:MAG: hypothetical protein IPM29_31550 [Planctomycetes bacterium]|nr:hypothetical protein [Planctomycetota bacterium]